MKKICVCAALLALLSPGLVRADCCQVDWDTLKEVKENRLIMETHFDVLGKIISTTGGEVAASVNMNNAALTKSEMDMANTRAANKRRVDGLSEFLRQNDKESKLMDADTHEANADPGCGPGTSSTAASAGMTERDLFAKGLETLMRGYLLTQSETSERQQKEQANLAQVAPRAVLTNNSMTLEQLQAMLATQRLLFPVPARPEPEKLDPNSPDGRRFLAAQARTTMAAQLAGLPWTTYMASRQPLIEAANVKKMMEQYGVNATQSISYKVDSNGKIKPTANGDVEVTEYLGVDKTGKPVKTLRDADLISLEMYYDILRKKYMSSKWLQQLNDEKNEIGALKETARLLTETNILLLDIRQSLQQIALINSVNVAGALNVEGAVRDQNVLGVSPANR